MKLDNWDIRIDVKDHGEYYTFNITRHIKIQDDKAIKKLISTFRDKHLIDIRHKYSYSVPSNEISTDVSVTIQNNTIIHNEIVRKFTTEVRKNLTTNYTVQNIQQLKNDLLDRLIDFDYTNAGHEKEASGFFRDQNPGFDDSGSEIIYFLFDDGSELESRCNLGQYSTLGSLKINNHTFFHSSCSFFYPDGYKKYFYGEENFTHITVEPEKLVLTLWDVGIGWIPDETSSKSRSDFESYTGRYYLTDTVNVFPTKKEAGEYFNNLGHRLNEMPESIRPIGDASLIYAVEGNVEMAFIYENVVAYFMLVDRKGNVDEKKLKEFINYGRIIEKKIKKAESSSSS